MNRAPLALALLFACAVAPARADGPPPELAEAARLSLAGEKRRALEILERLPPGLADPGEILMWRADLHLDLLEVERAVPLYRERLSRTPSDRTAVAHLVEALQLMGRTAEARQVYEDYLRVAGDDPEVARAVRSLEAQAAAIGRLDAAHRRLGWMNAALTAGWVGLLWVALRRLRAST